ncbi:MAG: protein kinase [Thermodesulfobacteriota bacterium]
MDELALCFEKGLAYKDMGLWGEAVREFRKALSHDVLKYRAGRQIAVCLMEMGQFEEAERVLVQILLALEIPREDRFKTSLDLAEVYLAMNRPESALERLVQSYHESPEFASTLLRKIHQLRRQLGICSSGQGPDTELAASIISAVRQAEVAYTTTMESKFSHYCEDQSNHTKIAISNPVEYSFDQSNWSTGYYTYISLSGMFVITYSPVPVGSFVFLRFTLPENPDRENIEVIGQVIRQESAQSSPECVLGMEVRFIKMDDRHEEVLRTFIERQHSEQEDAAQEIEKIRYLCDNCGRIVSVDIIGCGKRVKCLCGESVLVPYADHTPTRKNPLRGLKLAGCRVDDIIGQGATATVYKAHHLALDIPVAIKVFHPVQKREGSEILRRFLREARVIARINHPNVVGVMNAGEEHGYHFIVMQYVRGGNLHHLLTQNVRFSLPDFTRLFVDLCSALTAAHQQTVVHGDLKPANILITHAGKTMLGDFGLVRVLRKQSEEDARELIRGTPMYMSPEQAHAGHDIDIRSDIYSLAATMYHTLVGTPPFEGLTYREVIRKHLYDEPIPPIHIDPSIPPLLSAVVMKALRKDPDERFQSVEELRRILMRIATKEGIRRLNPLSKELVAALRTNRQ